MIREPTVNKNNRCTPLRTAEMLQVFEKDTTTPHSGDDSGTFNGYRVTDTGATDRANGQRCESVEYRDADEASLAWV
jgi:hypothetical protein